MSEHPAPRRSAIASATPRAHRPLLPIWPALAAAALAGLMLDLAFPSTGWWPLIFVGIGLSVVSLIGRSVRGAFGVGLVTGGVFFFSLITWIGAYLGPLPWVALAGVQTLFWALGSIVITLAARFVARLHRPRRTGARIVSSAALIAAVWTARELWMGSWPYSGFPWARMGMALSAAPPARLASWLGVTGLSFVCVFAVAALVLACAPRALWATGVASAPGIRPASPRARAATFAPALAAIAALLLVPQFATTPAGTMRIAAVQGNGPTGYFDEREPGDVLRAQLAATKPVEGEAVDLGVWPEGGIDSDPTRNGATAATLDALSRRVDAPLLVNAATAQGDEIFNTSMVWEAGAANPVATHDKRNPVPFGEYVPDRWLYGAIVPDLINLIQREYTPGTNSPAVPVHDVLVTLAICFDVIYDEVIWEGTRAGAEIAIYQTNNADFRGTEESAQQLGFARMRAVETGRSVVNISTIGTSEIIAADGQTIDSLPVDTAGVLLADVERRTGLTPAVTVGPVLNALLLWGSVVAFAAVGIAQRRRGTLTS